MQMAMVLDGKLCQEVKTLPNTYHSQKLISFFFSSSQIIDQLEKQPTFKIRTWGGQQIIIPGRDLQCLRPGQWLNDEVINGYLQLVHDISKVKGVVVLNSFFMSTLVRGYESARRTWIKAGYVCLYDD